MVEFPRRSEFIPAAKVRQVSDLAVEKRAREGLKSTIKENIKVQSTPQNVKQFSTTLTYMMLINRNA